MANKITCLCEQNKNTVTENLPHSFRDNGLILLSFQIKRGQFLPARPNRSNRDLMLSAVIATRDSERTLVPTLACLVPGATAGMLRDVIVADAGSSDGTAAIADIAGCRLMVAPGPLGARLKAAADSARGPWLLFLRAGTVLENSWVAEAVRFIADTEGSPDARAAIFRPASPGGGMRPTLADVWGLLGSAFGRRIGSDQGLLIAKTFYRQLDGHRDGDDPETDLLRRLGSRRTIVLRCLALPVRPAIA